MPDESAAVPTTERQQEMREHRMQPGLSVAIITKNEEATLAATLRSIAWAHEVIVVDSGSTDGTQRIAEDSGASFVRQEWLGFSRQKNFALSLCTREWILSLDEDEEVSPELAASVQEIIQNGSPTRAYSMARRNLFMGRWIRHGGFYPDEKLRLFRNGTAEFSQVMVHESLKCDKPRVRLKGDLIHRAYPSLTLYIEHMNRYSSLAALDMKRNRKHVFFIRDVLLRPVATFTHKYVLRRGFLDGMEGLMLNLFHALYVSWKYSTGWDMERRPIEEKLVGSGAMLDAGVFPSSRTDD